MRTKEVSFPGHHWLQSRTLGLGVRQQGVCQQPDESLLVFPPQSVPTAKAGEVKV